MKTFIAIIGARPQFIKHAPLTVAAANKFILKTIHTGQHYDTLMNDVFFDELKIPKPTFQLTVGSGTHAVQTAAMLVGIEEILLKEKPSAVIVYGDTNSTLAGALAAVKIHIPIIHIEAGLRSFNLQMPEEVNRILTDRISEVLFCTSTVAIEQLRKEGITKNVFLVGDVMKDVVALTIPRLKQIVSYPYYFATIHRPYNTDNTERLTKLLNALQKLKHPVILATHPRTQHQLRAFGINLNQFDNIRFIEPVRYFESLSYQFFSEKVLTDSGGIQKEAYFLRKPCITFRPETEWVETLANRWNQLVYNDLDALPQLIDSLPGQYDDTLYGDGKAAEKIAEILTKL
jgi:UDP-GlcNAc3NAcA epimerase